MAWAMTARVANAAYRLPARRWVWARICALTRPSHVGMRCWHRNRHLALPCWSNPAHEGCNKTLNPGLVQVPFACAVDDGCMTQTAIRIPAQSVDSVAAERLWDALYQARKGQSRRLVADLEDAAFRRYLPMARTLAHTEGGAQDADHPAIEQAAELGLNAILAWRQRTGAGFRRFARSSIIRELSSL